MVDVGLAALELDRKLDEVQAFSYRLTFDKDHDDVERVRLTRRGAGQLSRANAWCAVTDGAPWHVVSLTSLQTRQADWAGVSCTAAEEKPITLRSADSVERAIIQRLLNQCLMQGARALVRASDGRLSTEYGASSLVQIMATAPSERVQARSVYLDAFQTVTLLPEVLADGTALVGFDVRHRLLPLAHVTLDWVIRTRPEWLEGIRRVRHRYSIQGQAPQTAELAGVAEGRTAQSTFSTPQGEVSLFDYHRQKGNFGDAEADAVRNSRVVRVRYGKDSREPPRENLAALLQPMFDFDTLNRIDSALLERIAQRLKWPVGDRLKAAFAMVGELRARELGAGLKPVVQPERFVLNLKPPIHLRFGGNRLDSGERAVMRHGAYRGMSRKLIVPLVVGANEAESAAAQKHFRAVADICSKWAGSLPEWKTTAPAANAEELDKRLAQRTPDNTLLLIALGRGADKQKIRNVAYRYGLATQFMRLDHPDRIYQATYYNNLAAGLFSKAGGMLCAIDDMPGESDLFIGLDLGGVSQRAPGMAFLFTRDGAQLGWQLAESQRGERVEDQVLRDLLERSLHAFVRAHDGKMPRRITLHRDGRLFESLDVIRAFEKAHGVGLDVLEVVKSGSPPLYRRSRDEQGRQVFRNPEVGDAFDLPGLDEVILATYSGEELGPAWGRKVTVRPLRLRKRYGATDLHTLAQQVVLLSRIHGASLYRHPRLPVTTHHADRFATLRQECNLDDLSKMDRLCPVYL